MATAKPSFTDEPLPPEGRTLGEIVERMISREAWDFLTETVGDRPGSRQHITCQIAPRMLARLPPDHMWACAIRACLPIFDRWNSGVWIVKGRRGSPIEPPIEIPPPATGYDPIIKSFVRSTMIEPGSGGSKLIYDLRFYSPVTPMPGPTKTTASSSDPAPAALSDDPFRTGEPGRPGYYDLILGEAEYRIRTGLVVPKRRGLAKFKRSLWDWWEGVRHDRNAPEYDEGTIENIVRDLWNAALTANPTKLPPKK